MPPLPPASSNAFSRSQLESGPAGIASYITDECNDAESLEDAARQNGPPQVIRLDSAAYDSLTAFARLFRSPPATSMLLSLLKSKLHMAAVTRTELTYHGSITVDPELLSAVGMFPYEKVLVSNCSTGQRGETYVILGNPGERQVQLNGAMARLAQPGDRVIIMSFAAMTPDEAPRHRPRVAILDAKNDILEKFEGDVASGK